MYTITLKRTDSGWAATHSDPYIKRLFGTDTIPVPYSSSATVETVYGEIQRRNPDCIVIVGH